MKRIVFLLISSFLFTFSYGGERTYIADFFKLHLEDNQSFTYYNTTSSSKDIVTGYYEVHEDSVILTTHAIPGSKAIFAILTHNNWLQLSTVYVQPHFDVQGLFVPENFYLYQEETENDLGFSVFYWEDFTALKYTRYDYSLDKELMAILRFEANVLHGEQLYFFKNHYQAPQVVAFFNEGKATGKWLYFEPVDDKFVQIQMVKKEKYKNGVLVQVKTPATPPIFYTNHFLHSS